MSRPERAVFRLPGIALLIPFLLFVCVTPLANAGADFLLALYLLPAVGLAYILFTRTVADTEVIRTTGLLGGRRVAWADLDGLEFHGPRWAIAVATDGRRFRLPMVRPRDLPRLAQVSGGRLLLGRDAPVAPDDEAEGEVEQVGPVDVPADGAERVDIPHPQADHPGVEEEHVPPAAGQPDHQPVDQPAAQPVDHRAAVANGHPEPLVKAADGRPTDE